MKGRSEQQASEGQECEQLRAALAEVTAERDQLTAQLSAARAALHLCPITDCAADAGENHGIMCAACWKSANGDTIAELVDAREALSRHLQEAALGPGKTIAELEKAAILVSMARHDNAVAKVAKELGLSKRTVHYRLKDYGKPA